MLLREVEVKSAYPMNNMGFKRVRMDSAILLPHINADLSKVLSQYSTIFIKTYGNGSLATASFRGTSANHTQVEWNGINLNSPMLGQMDLSQVPVSQFDKVEILFGASGISRTSGAFGGIINLAAEPDWNNRVNATLAQSFASFNTYTTAGNLMMGNRKIQSLTKINYTTSQNDFPYYNEQREKVKQTNASYNQWGLSEDVFWQVAKKQLFSAKIWYAQDFNNLPPIVTNVDSTTPNHTEYEEDRALRTMIEYKYIGNSLNAQVISALIDQQMHYVNDSLDQNHHYYSLVNRVRFSYTRWKKWTIKPGMDMNYDWVVSEAYEGIKTRGTYGLFGEFGYQAAKILSLSVNLRQDMIDNIFQPFIAAAGAEIRPFRKVDIGFSMNLSRNYRYPTLNDLYWVPFGNPDLKPELNYAVEAGTVYHLLTKNNKWFIEAQLTGYYSWIYDLIQWAPVPGSSYVWKPENIAEVHARGIEAGLNVTLDILGFKWSLQNNYNYCKSTNEKATSPSDQSVGKQLIYVPEHLYNGTFTMKNPGYFFSYNFTYTSRRYTGTDNKTYMPGYNLSNIILGKNFLLKKFILSLQLEINNLFDLDYQSIASRPMPGRNFAITIRGNFREGVR